jgi:cytochrome c oxidase cbb3-type subunit III
MNQQVEHPASVESPSPGEVEKLTDHAYDGITEYDNPIPGWWSLLWVGTIVFSVFYYMVATLSDDMTNAAEFAYHEEIDIKRNLATYMAMKPERATFLELQKDPKALILGKSLFKGNCISCHGESAGGMTTAPNLTDDRYIYVTQVDQLYDVIFTGQANNAVPGQGTKLKPAEIMLLANYVASLRGTNAPGGLSPRGEHTIKSWE